MCLSVLGLCVCLVFDESVNFCVAKSVCFSYVAFFSFEFCVFVVGLFNCLFVFAICCSVSLWVSFAAVLSFGCFVDLL